MSQAIAFFGMILFITLATKGAWAVLTANPPKRMRVWCVTCNEELIWLVRPAGQSKYAHAGDADHPAALTTVAPAQGADGE